MTPPISADPNCVDVRKDRLASEVHRAAEANSDDGGLNFDYHQASKDGYGRERVGQPFTLVFDTCGDDRDSCKG